MAVVLHLLTRADATLPREVIEQQQGAGDRVTVAVLPGAGAVALPPGVSVRRLSADLSYDELLELIFAADQLIAW